MNKTTDTIFGTQLSTGVAAALTFVAHLQSSRLLLNENWDWLAILCVITAAFFMLLPHLICHDKPELPPYIEECNNQPVIAPNGKVVSFSEEEDYPRLH